jgi:hypothetical protein
MTDERTGNLPRKNAPGVGDRLRIYLIGVGIGVILLGAFWLLKNQAAQNQPLPSNPGQVTPTRP